MGTKIKLEMPEEAAIRLREKIEAGDPEGVALLQSFGVVQIVFSNPDITPSAANRWPLIYEDQKTQEKTEGATRRFAGATGSTRL